MKYLDRDGVTIYNADCRTGLDELADQSVHCVVTSPPYFGLRDYQVDGQIGLEASPDAYIQEMVELFRGIHRVLRDDGTVWLNIGDSYPSHKGASQGVERARRFGVRPNDKPVPGFKHKDRMGIPHRLVFALQADGWYWRDEIVWRKNSPMPESVTDRTTKAHEFIFLLSKSPKYFFDNEAIKEPVTGNAHSRGSGTTPKSSEKVKNNDSFSKAVRGLVSTRNKRSVWDIPSDDVLQWLAEHHSEVLEQYLTGDKESVWTVNTKPYGGAHFAVFPPKLITPCIQAGTSEFGCCPSCGAQHVRIVEKHREATRPGNDTKVGRVSDDPDSPYEGRSGMIVGNRDPQRHTTVTKTVGSRPGCECGEKTTVKPVVLDPFMGSGTTAAVCQGLGRHAIGFELNPEYCELIASRFEQRVLF